MPNSSLVIEKEAAMMRIVEDRWWRKYPCIALTAQGVGNVATLYLSEKNQ